jgi:hypothetical protein
MVGQKMISRLIAYGFISMAFAITNANALCVTGDCENGWGEYHFEQGGRYVGDWKNSIPDGNGKMYFHDGRTYEGPFSEGFPHGWGEYRYPDGNKMQVNSVKGSAEGTGECTMADGTFYHCCWKDGSEVTC